MSAAATTHAPPAPVPPSREAAGNAPRSGRQPRQNSGFGGAAIALATREWVRFFRQRHRVIAAVVTPLLLWLLLGLGLRDAFGAGVLPERTLASGAASGAFSPGSLSFYYPGAVVLMVMFTSIFTCISVIEDRREGFLQGVLASRAPRSAIVAGKVFGGAGIAVAQGLALVALGLAVLPWPTVGGLVAAVLALVLLSVMLTALGLCFAWPMESTAGYHGVMNLVLMPMWLLSGGLFPAATAAEPLRWAMRLNPLAHGHEVFAAGLLGTPPTLAPAWVSWLVVLATTLALMALAARRVAAPGESS